MKIHVREIDGQATAIATNGRALAFVPVEMADDDKLGVYPAAAFAAARKSYQDHCDPEMAFPGSRHIAEAQVELQLVGEGVARMRDSTTDLVDGPEGRRHKETVVTSTEWRTEGSTKFPDAVALLNELCAKWPTGRITLDVENLVILAKALGSTGLQIELHGRTGPMVVRPINSMGVLEEGIGLLMPIACGEDFEADKQAGGTK